MPSDAVVEGVAGAIGGCVATIATFPLMTVSIQQAMRVKDRNQPKDDETVKRGTIHEITQVVKTSGWQALFSGLSASLVGTTVSQGIYFYLYSLLRSLAVARRGTSGTVDSRSQQVTVAESLLMAAIAGAGNVLLTNPIWMVATRMQAHRQHISNAANNKATSTTSSKDSTIIPTPIPTTRRTPISVAREVYADYGVGGFWNGMGPSLVMVINPTIQYALYEWLSSLRAKRSKLKNVRPTALEVFLTSALAKAGATVLTYPLMTIKTRMMSARKSDADIQYASVLDAVFTIAKREGIFGYYRGIRTKIVQSVLAGALLFMCKEKITDVTRDVLLAKKASRAISR